MISGLESIVAVQFNYYIDKYHLVKANICSVGLLRYKVSAYTTGRNCQRRILRGRWLISQAENPGRARVYDR